MLTLNFYQDKKSSALYLYIRGVVTNKTKKVNTKLSVIPEQWHSEKQSVKSSHPNSVEYNRYLNKLRDDISNLYSQFLFNNDYSDFTKKVDLLFQTDLAENRSSNIEPHEPIIKVDSFFEMMEKWLEQKSINNSLGTTNTYRYLRDLLLKFENQSKIKIVFEDFNMVFYDNLVQYLIKQSYSPNYIHKVISFLKTFLYWCEAREIKINPKFKTYSYSKEKKEIISLTCEELTKIVNLDLTKTPYLDRIRDYFVFACYTGQRYSDYVPLRFSKHISNGKWTLVQQKTDAKVVIPLLEIPLKIIEKYNDIDKLPIISNQKTNSYVKELAKLAEINTIIEFKKTTGGRKKTVSELKYNLITSHTARKTFITQSLEKGIPERVVMQMSGHTDAKEFSKYVNFSKIVAQDIFLNAWR